MEEQAIACLACGASELIRADSDRLLPGHWPAWTPGPQPFACPACHRGPVWAAQPRPTMGRHEPDDHPDDEDDDHDEDEDEGEDEGEDDEDDELGEQV